jgi:hypothetical protein
VSSTQEPKPQDREPDSTPESEADPPPKEEPGPGAQIADEAQARAEELDTGPKLNILGAEVSRRTLLALGLFVLVFLVVWIALWGVLGGVGLALGWIVATAAGGAAVWWMARRSPAR